MKKAHLLTFGCRLNHAEANLIEGELGKAGYSLTTDKSEVDLFVINSCTVTERADQKCRQLVRSLKRNHPSAKIAVVGCYAQTSANELARIRQIDYILGNQEKLRLSQYISEGSQLPLNPFPMGCNANAEMMERAESNLVKQKTEVAGPQVFVARVERKEFALPLLPKYAQARVNLKIQDGCDFFCSFCVIPFARGRSRSRKLTDILAEARHLANLGVKEVVLTGVNMGLYHSEGTDFIGLLDNLAAVQGLERIRISSIEPTTIDQRLIDRLANKASKLAPFLHLPIQAATDTVLVRMKRRYSLAEFDTYLQKVVQAVPDICIGTDLITGFPGETDADFASAMDYLKSAPIHFFHVFPYSNRPGTQTSHSLDKVKPTVINERAQQARALSANKWQTYQTQFIGKEEDVVLEQYVLKPSKSYNDPIQPQKELEVAKLSEDFWIGHSAHYINVKVYAQGLERRQNIRVKILHNTLHNSTLTSPDSLDSLDSTPFELKDSYLIGIPVEQ